MLAVVSAVEIFSYYKTHSRTPKWTGIAVVGLVAFEFYPGRIGLTSVLLLLLLLVLSQTAASSRLPSVPSAAPANGNKARIALS
jgi:chromate transport protein ChrA